MAVSVGGTGTLTLSDAVPGFLTFDQAGVANGATVSYAIASGINAEVGRGVYNTANKTLTRGPLRSTNGNAAVDVAVNAQVFITILAEDYNEKANLASPSLTGNPTAPTQAKGNRSTRLASTAFVGNELADYYTQVQVDALTWNLSSLQQSTGPNVLGRASGLGAPQFLTPANLMQILAPFFAGEYVYIPGGVIPAGRRILKANGATLNRADYPDLWNFAQNSGGIRDPKTAATFGLGNGSTTFQLPDARGYFLRAFDDGRGVDAGRLIHEIQASAMHQHSHTLPMGFGGITLYTWLDANNAPIFGSEIQGETSNAEYAAATTGGARPSRIAWTSGVVRQSGETRPVNLAAVLGIRY